MSTQHATQEGGPRSAGDHARQRLLAGLPVTERRLPPAGVSTAVLEGGDGRDDPVIEQPEAFLDVLRAALDDSSRPAFSPAG